jgi:hypothetical protein
MENERVSEYRRKAKECRAKAARAADEVTRDKWVMMADGWEILARESEEDKKAG